MNTLPPEITCRQTIQGVRYVFPRHRGPRAAGVVAMLFGGAFATFALCFAGVAVAFAFEGGGGVDVLGGVCMALFALPFLAIGMAIFGFGLHVVGGHSELEVRGETLIAADGWGPFKWRRRCKAADIRSLTVIPAGERLSGSFAISVHTAGKKKPMQCANGYPDDWLEVVAADLSQQLNVATAGGKQASSPALAHAETVLPAAHTDDARRRDVTLPFDRSSGGLLAIIIFAVIWNGISWGIGAVVFFTDDGAPLFAKIIIGVFMLIGLILVFAAVKMALARSRLHPPQVTLSVQPLYVGEPFRGTFLQRAKSGARIERVQLKLICRESATYRRGTDTTTVTHDAFTEEVTLAEGTEANSVQAIEGEFQFQIPEDAMHSFAANRNKIYWLITTNTHVAGWPDYAASFTVEVAARRHGGAAGQPARK